MNRLTALDSAAQVRRYNKSMFDRISPRFCLLFAFFVLVFGSIVLSAQDDSQHMRKYKAPPAAAHIEVTVVKDFNGKPITDAHVIFHPIQGDKDEGYLELKTNEDGRAIIDVLPIGDTVRMQIIATGYQTYGQDYKVDKAEMSMEIRMKRPGGQYSIYKDNDAAPKSDKGSGNSSPGKSANPPQSSTPPTSENKSDKPPAN